VAVDPRGDSRVDPQTALTVLWRDSLSMTGRTHERLTSICFLTITNCQIVRFRSLTRRTNYKLMCLSAYWQWKLANERARISAVIVKSYLEHSWFPILSKKSVRPRALPESCHVIESQSVAQQLRDENCGLNPVSDTGIHNLLWLASPAVL